MSRDAVREALLQLESLSREIFWAGNDFKLRFCCLLVVGGRGGGEGGGTAGRDKEAVGERGGVCERER